jgi:hypothetical protein
MSKGSIEITEEYYSQYPQPQYDTRYRLSRMSEEIELLRKVAAISRDLVASDGYYPTESAISRLQDALCELDALREL